MDVIKTPVKLKAQKNINMAKMINSYKGMSWAYKPVIIMKYLTWKILTLFVK